MVTHAIRRPACIACPVIKLFDLRSRCQTPESGPRITHLSECGSCSDKVPKAERKPFAGGDVRVPQNLSRIANVLAAMALYRAEYKCCWRA